MAILGTTAFELSVTRPNRVARLSWARQIPTPLSIGTTNASCNLIVHSFKRPFSLFTGPGTSSPGPIAQRCLGRTRATVLQLAPPVNEHFQNIEASPDFRG